MTTTIEFYSADTADDSDPDPTWRLTDIPFPRDTAEMKMIRILELLFSTAPVSLRQNAEHDDAWDVFTEENSSHPVFLGVMFVLEDAA